MKTGDKQVRLKWDRLLGAGLAIGVVICGVAGLLSAVGIASSSIAFGFIRRSPAAGLRAVFLQVGAATGVPGGVVAALLLSHLTHSRWSVGRCILLEGLSGLISGFLTAWFAHEQVYRAASGDPSKMAQIDQMEYGSFKAEFRAGADSGHETIV